jgi:hypothetical protein
MSHFAKVNQQGIVTNVIVAEQEFIDQLVDDSPGKWVKTSYNTRGGVHFTFNETTQSYEQSEDQSQALRKNFASIGGTYNKQLDAFIPVKAHASWVLNEETCLFEPPTPKPTPEPEGGMWVWNEDEQNWITEQI